MSLGYVVLHGVDEDAVAAAMDEADAAVEGFTASLSKKLEDDLPPLAEDDVAEDPRGKKASCRGLGPWSPCK